MEDFASLDVRIEDETSVPSCVDGGAFQHPMSEMERLKAEETNGRATDAREILHNGKGNLLK